MSGNIGQSIADMTQQAGPLGSAPAPIAPQPMQSVAAPTQVSTSVNPAAPQPIGGK